jgi:hypothetical protein
MTLFGNVSREPEVNKPNCLSTAHDLYVTWPQWHMMHDGQQVQQVGINRGSRHGEPQAFFFVF